MNPMAHSKVLKAPSNMRHNPSPTLSKPPWCRYLGWSQPVPAKSSPLGLCIVEQRPGSHTEVKKLQYGPQTLAQVLLQAMFLKGVMDILATLSTLPALVLGAGWPCSISQRCCCHLKLYSCFLRLRGVSTLPPELLRPRCRPCSASAASAFLSTSLSSPASAVKDSMMLAMPSTSPFTKSCRMSTGIHFSHSAHRESMSCSSAAALRTMSRSVWYEMLWLRCSESNTSQVQVSCGPSLAACQLERGGISPPTPGS